MTAIFTLIDSKRTQVDFIQIIDDQEICDSVKDFAIVANMEHQMKFEAENAKLTGEIVPVEFVTTREFKTDLNTMWKMWTEPSHMVKWLSPKEVSAGKCEMDFRREWHFSLLSGFI